MIESVFKKTANCKTVTFLKRDSNTGESWILQKFWKTLLQNTFGCLLKKSQHLRLRSAMVKSPGLLNSRLYPLFLENTCIAQNICGRFLCLNIIFFICYLATPRPTLRHCGGRNLTNSMLITTFDTYST